MLRKLHIKKKEKKSTAKRKPILSIATTGRKNGTRSVNLYQSLVIIFDKLTRRLGLSGGGAVAKLDLIPCDICLTFLLVCLLRVKTVTALSIKKARLLE